MSSPERPAPPLRALAAFLALTLSGSPLAALAQEGGMHPSYPLLDADSVSVLASGGPVSPMTTCGQCHDTRFIADHSTHATVGPFALTDLGTGAGGPAADGEKPHGSEMNCFMCHVSRPDAVSSTAPMDGGGSTALADDDPRWEATATLAGTGVVSKTEGTWGWNRESFDSQGRVKQDVLAVQDPGSASCGQCHGMVDDGADGPVALGRVGAREWSTLTTGEVFSPRRISESAINLAGKDSLTRSWDVHAERLLECVDCHYSVSNPLYRRESDATRPDHLKFDGRRMPLGVYLKQPSHYFAGESRDAGSGAEAGAGAGADGCESCHDPAPAHRWLPDAARHMARLECTVCHTPRLHGVAARVADRTVVEADGSPRIRLRGTQVRGLEVGAADLVQGFEPTLLAQTHGRGESKIAPYNLVTSWFWVAGDPESPIPSADVEAAFLESGGYRPEIVSVFDANQNGTVDPDELMLDRDAKVEVVRSLLVALGWNDPRIRGEVRPYPVHHGTADADWSTRSCRSCHAGSSRLGGSVLLAEALPGGVVPRLAGDSPAKLDGGIELDDRGRLVYRSDTQSAGLYVLGHDGVRWANGLGLLTVLGVLGGVILHAVLRYRTARRRRGSGEIPGAGPDVYMYTAYERFWHWLQALAIILLLTTGLEVHFPGMRLFGFALAVQVHNIVGFVVVGNAIFAALYNVASGEIRQYLPEPKGFFGQAIAQGRYYLYGIFHGQPHPFRKSPDRKLNPLQKVTYLAILNILLPLQMVTGILIWGVQRWPGIEAATGGLSVLAPVHALGAWMFAAFLLLHVYLTTTGPTPTANVMAMVVGWERAETIEEGLEAS